MAFVRNEKSGERGQLDTDIPNVERHGQNRQGNGPSGVSLVPKGGLSSSEKGTWDNLNKYRSLMGKPILPYRKSGGAKPIQ
jgi:hypothetical protein